MTIKMNIKPLKNSNRMEQGLMLLSENPHMNTQLINIIGGNSEECSTFGGHMFWDNLSEFAGWRLQKNWVFDNYRILDPNDNRKTYSYDDSIKCGLNKLAEIFYKNGIKNNIDLSKKLKNEFMDNSLNTVNRLKDKCKNLGFRKNSVVLNFIRKDLSPKVITDGPSINTNVYSDLKHLKSQISEIESMINACGTCHGAFDYDTETFIGFEYLLLNFHKFSNLFQDFSKIITELAELYIEMENCDKINIIAVGLLKAGKSTLMNCLTGNSKDEYFKTGVIRETLKNKSYEIGNIVYTDTPGLDAELNDELEAESSLLTADLVLFVHNINDGELDEPEINYMNMVSNSCESSDEFIKKTVFVLTNLDKKDYGTRNDSFEIVNRLKEQVVSLFSNYPDVISVSSTRYLKGVNETKRVFEERSNFYKLHDILNTKKAITLKEKKGAIKRQITIRNEILLKSLKQHLANKNEILENMNNTIDKNRLYLLREVEVVENMLKKRHQLLLGKIGRLGLENNFYR